MTEKHEETYRRKRKNIEIIKNYFLTYKNIIEIQHEMGFL